MENKKETEKETCEKIKRFWRWTWKESNHDWAYFKTDRWRRKCLKCGRKEILFSTDETSGFENWRQNY